MDNTLLMTTNSVTTKDWLIRTANMWITAYDPVGLPTPLPFGRPRAFPFTPHLNLLSLPVDEGEIFDPEVEF